MKLKLNGGNTFCNAWLKTNDDDSAVDVSALKDSPMNDIVWDENTLLGANFKYDSDTGAVDISGSNFGGSFGSDIKYFKIYKTLSNQPQLHKVFSTKGSYFGTIEDFLVGDKCPYRYSIYPVQDVGDGVEKLGTLIQSDVIEVNDGIIRIIGLIQDPDNPNRYDVDLKNIWHLQFNISDEGFTNNMAKSYPDTLHQFQKKIQGNGNYRTFPISGLLGKFDCETHKYTDTYDDIVEWEEFMNNGQLKAVIDLRGVITLGDIDSNSFQYDPSGANMVSVSFTFRELESINNVQIFNRQLIANPLRHKILADMYGRPLMTTEDDGEHLFLLSTEDS